MRTTEGNQLFSILRCKTGREAAISAPELARLLGWPLSQERRVREIIADESALWPVLIVSEAGNGFFAAETFEEIEKHDSWLSLLVDRATMKRDEFRAVARKHGFRVNPNLERRAA